MNYILLFTRYPRPGKVKTRMIEHLGPEGAAELHGQMTEQVIRQLQPVFLKGSTQLWVHYCGGSAEEMMAWLGDNELIRRQQGDDLGERMAYAFAKTWQQGGEKVLLIGSDCPAIDADIITKGLEKLDRKDLVLGPAMDGGYYLIGLRSFAVGYEELFKAIDWGTGRVLAQTIDQAKKLGLSFSLLPQLHDIDRAEDLVHFDYHPCSE
ncbi:MAG: glycosyltransferase [Candidatus Electrothrix sp. AR3]|nr:glycosyltransferase [Candidatus Electrothrix sp. AR3]